MKTLRGAKPSPIRVVGAGVLAVAIGIVAAGCAPEPEPAAPSDTASSTATSSATPPPTTPSPTAGAAEIELPASCDDIYSDDMFADLEAQNPPLNDPGVTMLSTENAGLLEMLDTLPTLRCSWGPPGESGLATNVSIVDAEQAVSVTNQLAAAGFGCADESGVVLCRIEQRGVTLDDHEYTRGETHAVRGNAWISTAWINFAPDGYTEDIVATLGL